MRLGEPWTGGYIFPWSLALRLEEASSQLMRWHPENYQLAPCLEVRVYLEPGATRAWKAAELLVRQSFLRHPWKINLACRAIGEFLQEVSPALAERLNPLLPRADLQRSANPKPSLHWLEDTRSLTSSSEAGLWVRESSPWRGIVVAAPGVRPCVFCRAPAWDTAAPCPGCGKKAGGLLERLGKLSWLLNRPKLD